MEIGYITDCGNVRTENQDRLLVLERRMPAGEATLCAVADGMGGTGDGSLASDLVVQRLRVWWQEELERVLEQKAVLMYVSRSLDLLIRDCNEEILRQSHRCCVSTGTTLSLLFAYGGQALVKHVGDSRIYLERSGQWTQLTKDHTWEQQELDRGVDPKADVSYQQKKGALTNALGACEECRVDTQVLQTVQGDRYLLCSDGFYRYIDPENQMKEGGSAQAVLEKKAGQIRATAAADNFTAVLAVNGNGEASRFSVRTVRLT